jgi:hypothetical protein
LEKGVINADEKSRLLAADKLRIDAINVDDFAKL